MHVAIFGATGMVGQGVLRECQIDDRITGITTIGRVSSGKASAKLREIILPDLFVIEGELDALRGCDACFYCLGVSAAGMSEADYAHITYDLTMAIAKPLASANPSMTFVYISGMGTGMDSRMMWGRVKARTEAALAALPFRAVCNFRPGFIQPMHGARSSTRWYRALYAATGPLAAFAVRMMPGWATTTEQIGRAMIAVALNSGPPGTFDNQAINRAAGSHRPAAKGSS